MNIVRINSYNTQNNNFAAKNKAAKPFLQQEKPDYKIVPARVSSFYYHPSFAARNPKAAFYRAQQLKELYAQYDLPYLLPHEVKSNKEILELVDLFGKKLDELKTLNKETVQKAIDEILPENLQNRIIVKDFRDFEEELKKRGHSKLTTAGAGAVTLIKTKPDSTFQYILFFKFSKQKYRILNFNKQANKIKTVTFKEDIEHELTHALWSNLKNIGNRDTYAMFLQDVDIEDDTFFIMFELNCLKRRGSNLKTVDLTQENMLEWLGFNSIGELHNDFESVFNHLIGKAPKDFVDSLNTPERSIPFLSKLKHNAQEEKLAYTRGKRLRERLGNSNMPTNRELIPLVYAEMEKFFARKERECANKALMSCTQ